MRDDHKHIAIALLSSETLHTALSEHKYASKLHDMKITYYKLATDSKGNRSSDSKLIEELILFGSSPLLDAH